MTIKAEGNMDTGISTEVEVPEVVVSGYGNGANTNNFVAICDQKGDTIRQDDGTVIHAYTEE